MLNIFPNFRQKFDKIFKIFLKKSRNFLENLKNCNFSLIFLQIFWKLLRRRREPEPPTRRPPYMPGSIYSCYPGIPPRKPPRAHTGRECPIPDCPRFSSGTTIWGIIKKRILDADITLSYYTVYLLGHNSGVYFAPNLNYPHLLEKIYLLYCLDGEPQMVSFIISRQLPSICKILEF